MISVVIATHNRSALLRANMTHLLSTAYPQQQFEVIVVDDCSSDETQSVLAGLRAAHTNFSFLKTPENVGPARARNMGIKQAVGDIVAITDDDIWVGDDWLQRIHQFFGSHPAAVGVHGSIEIAPQDKDKITPFTKQAEAHTYGDFYTGNIAYRRDVLVRVGGFDEQFPPSNEDMELGLAMLAVGPIGFEPAIAVFHPVFPSTFWEQVRFRRHYWTELVLERRYPVNYRQLRGGGALRTMLGYWLLKVFVVDFARYSRTYWKQPGMLVLAVVRLIVERLYCLVLVPSFLLKAARFPARKRSLRRRVSTD